MEKLSKTNRDFAARFVLEHISGKNLTIKDTVSKSGLNYGLMKAMLYASYVLFLDTANQNYIALRITGLSSHRKTILIFQDASILSTMELIFIRKDVLSV